MEVPADRLDVGTALGHPVSHPSGPVPVRLTAREYLGLIGAVAELESAAEENPAVYGEDARAANRALRKLSRSMTPATLREVDRLLGC